MNKKNLLLVILVALAIIIILFLKTNILISDNVVSSTLIRAPSHIAFNKVNDMNGWFPEILSQNYSNDSSVSGGLSVGVGAKTYFISDGIERSIEIKESYPYSLITRKICWEDKEYMIDTLKFNESDKGTNLEWVVKCNKDNIRSFVNWILNKKTIEGKIENILTSLKDTCEQSYLNKTDIKIAELEPKNVISITDTFISRSQLKTNLVKYLYKLDDIKRHNNLEYSGNTFTIRHKFDTLTPLYVIEVGFPVNRLIHSTDSVKSYILKPGRVVQATHYGDLANSDITRKYLLDFASAENLKLGEKSYMISYINPSERDPSKWKTILCYPIINTIVEKKDIR